MSCALRHVRAAPILARRAERNAMKHSLASDPDPVPALFDLLTAGLLASPALSPSGAAVTEPRPSLLDRLEAAHWRWRQRQIERCLAGSADIADVERRLKALERHSFFA